jgi:hypothetical protein
VPGATIIYFGVNIEDEVSVALPIPSTIAT